MSTKRRLASVLLGGCVAISVAAAPATTVAASTPSAALPSLPLVSSALAGAAWMAPQVTSAGYVSNGGTPAAPSLSNTANVLLALASTGVDQAAAHRALIYLSSHVNAYVKVSGKDDPDELALLILDVHSMGSNPANFGGTDLVTRLLATQQTSGVNKGLFGSQDPTYDGAYRQGLSLAALAGSGVTSGSQVSLAEQWLESQQCPDGGWTTYITKANPCNGKPANFAGPDTNSTALAIEGLSAQGVLGAKAAGLASTFIAKAQDSDGGWGYEPNAAGAPGSTDPDSTALVIQAILALGESPSATSFDKKSSNPISALRSFQRTSGSGAGAFVYPGISGPDLIATYQAVPAMSSVKFPYYFAVITGSLPKGSVGVSYSATLMAHGGNGADTWRLASGSALPAGLSLDATTGVISGKPKSTGVTTFTVEAFDTKTTAVPATQNVAWKVLSITV